jgi:hypothetical protein
MRQFKSVAPWAHSLAMRGSLILTGAIILFASSSLPLALVPTANAQVVIGVGVSPPMCSYGYYNYAPYGCAPMGFYGPGYFYNGIFLGVGPWANWGYGHGWGEHRFSGGGGGRYVGVRGNGGRAYAGNRGRGPAGARGSSGGARGGASHSASRGGSAHSSASRGGGSHGGGERH